MPIRAGPVRVGVPAREQRGPGRVVALGADLAPGTLLAAYRAGLFPMPVPRRRHGLVAARTRGGSSPSTASTFAFPAALGKRYEITVDRAFAPVVEGCADPRARAPGSRPVRAAYTVLHALGWAHSVEAGCGRRSPAGSTAWRSAGSSPPSRSSTWDGRLQGRGRGARGAPAGSAAPAPARRPVATAHLGRWARSTSRAGSTCAGWPRHCRCPPRSGERGRAAG